MHALPPMTAGSSVIRVNVSIDHASCSDNQRSRSYIYKYPATRKPILMSWYPPGFPTRLAGRLAIGRLSQEPPRIMRCVHVPSCPWTKPSEGAAS